MVKSVPFTQIHRSLLEEVEWNLNRSITKFYNSDDVNATAAGLRQTKAMPISMLMTDNLLYHSHKKRKNSLETRVILLIFSLKFKISGVAVQSIHHNSKKW